MSKQYKKKLIEVSLPLEAINKASAREKSIRHGHPSTLHLWWARRPLAAARAVIFAQMVDDPSEHAEELLAMPEKRKQAQDELAKRLIAWVERKKKYTESRAQGDNLTPAPGPEPTLDECAADIERERLFEIIRKLVLWENTTNEMLLTQARAEIHRSWRNTCADNQKHPGTQELFDPETLPAFHDPFAGGGALPLEAQRLGLEAYASDLNPVAVLINKAMIELPGKFAGQPPVSYELRKDRQLLEKRWHGSEGLAEDIRYYGKWLRDEAEKRIGHLYPKIEITPEMATERSDLEGMVGRKLTVIAWLWARTVKSPNPAFAHVDVPLASTFMLSTKNGREAYVEPVINGDRYRFVVRVGKPKNVSAFAKGMKVGRGGNFKCLISQVPIPVEYIRKQGMAGTLGHRLMAVVAEGDSGRLYLTPTEQDEAIALSAIPDWAPEQEINYNPRDIRTQLYGLVRYSDLFTRRQLVALTTFSDLIHIVHERVKADAGSALLATDCGRLEAGGIGADAYADAIAVYLGIGISRLTNRSSTLNFWDTKGENVQQVFARQALAMTWDYVEGNPFSDSTGNFIGQLDYMVNAVLSLPRCSHGHVTHQDAATQTLSSSKIISTDPPYYDNIGYADLSDFFYVWLRRSLKPYLPNLFATLTVPKAEELVATPYRHGTKEKAEIFFLEGMTRSMRRLVDQAHPAFPVTIYYAFRQSERDEGEGTASTGWETFLDAVIRAGFAITGTWPIRTEYTGNLKRHVSALASSIVLVCRRQLQNAQTATRREFLQALKSELPKALIHLQRGNIAPVDLAQAAIGPGMGIYTRYFKVLDAEGRQVTVRDALALINETLDEVLAEQEGDFDADSRWALVWFEQSGFSDGEYGVAEMLSKAKNTSIAGMVDAGILVSKAGKVRLLRPSELLADWDPGTDEQLTVWAIVHHMVRALESSGESAAAALVAKLGAKAQVARELAYRLYAICERKKRAQEALSYNSLVQSWPEIIRMAQKDIASVPEQAKLIGLQ